MPDFDPKKQIYGFAFGKGNVSAYALWRLKNIDQDKIRIETKCSNQFRNNFIESNHLHELEIKPFLKPNQSAKFAQGIGNSYCNMAGWKIMSKINKGELKSKYTFLHVPKYFKTWQAVAEIDEMLFQFKKANFSAFS